MTSSLTAAVGCPVATSARRHRRNQQQQQQQRLRPQPTLVSQPRHRHGHHHHPRLNTALAATATDASGAEVHRLRGASRGSTLRCRAGGGKKGGPFGLFDEMLDVMEGGPKLRKWYGQDSSVGDPDAERAAYDGGDDDAEVPQVAVVDREEELRAWDKQPRRTTLVTGADTQLGEAVIMQLIVAKQPVTALGITPEVAESRYGPYVTGVDEDDAAAVSDVLRRGVRAVICAGKAGALPQAAAADGKVKHVVLVSAAGVSSKGGGGGGGIFAAFGGEEARRKDPKREAAFISATTAAKIPLTIVRPSTIRASFGGKPLVFSQGDDGGGGGDLSLEDAAEVCVRCLGAPPSGGDVIAFEVRNSKAGADGAAKRDWRALFGGLSSTK